MDGLLAREAVGEEHINAVFVLKWNLCMAASVGSWLGRLGDEDLRFLKRKIEAFSVRAHILRDNAVYKKAVGAIAYRENVFFPEEVQLAVKLRLVEFPVDLLLHHGDGAAVVKNFRKRVQRLLRHFNNVVIQDYIVCPEKAVGRVNDVLVVGCFVLFAVPPFFCFDKFVVIVALKPEHLGEVLREMPEARIAQRVKREAVCAKPLGKPRNLVQSRVGKLP